MRRTELGTDVENFVEDAAVGYCDVDGYPWWRGHWADIGLGVENHDDGGTIVEMGVEVPLFIASAFKADVLTVLKFYAVLPETLVTLST
jgi:hypothetical protein